MSSPEVKIILSLIDQTKEGLASAGLNVKNYGQVVEEESRKIQVSWKDVATSVSGVITAGFALYSMYENIQRQQLMVLRLTNSLEDAQRRQNNALDKLNEAIAEHGASSEEAAKVQEAYDAACKDVVVVQERLAYTENNLNEAMLRAALFTIPSVITAVDRGTVAYKELSKAVDAVAAGEASLATTTVAAAGIIGIAAAAVGVMYVAFEKLAEYIYDVSDAEERLQEETLRTAEVFEGLDTQLKGIEAALPEVEKEVDELTQVFITGADQVKKSYFDVFTKESQEFQDDLETTANLVRDFLTGGIEPSFGSAALIIENFADRWGITFDEAKVILMDFIKTTRDGLIEQMETLRDSYFDVFTEESEGFQADLQAMGQTAYEVMSGMQPDFASLNTLIQEFADRWGLTWDEAEEIIMEKVEEIKATIGTVAPTLEEELVGKAQAAMERFKECMGEKSTATRDEMRAAMEDMVSSINELISYGLLGEAQALMDTFKKAEPDKMWTMVQDIDAAIESLTVEMETEFEEMLALADTLSGEERDLMIQRAEELKEGYLAKIEELENMRSIILTRMQLETQGYSDEEINIIMSGLTTLQALSGAKWDEITRIWEQCLDEAEGDVSAAVSAIQGMINSLQGKTIYITTVYREIFETITGVGTGAAGTSSGGGYSAGTSTTPTGTTPGVPWAQLGVPYVPYTGFLRRLERGEAILTVEEAERWRRGGGRSVQIGPNYFTIASDMDIRETARKLARYVAQEERRLGLD